MKRLAVSSFLLLALPLSARADVGCTDVAVAVAQETGAGEAAENKQEPGGGDGASGAQQNEAVASDASARERALDKTRNLLLQRPTHAALFDRYFKMLVEANAVEPELERLEARRAKDASDTAATVVLGRLLLRMGKEERALEVLEGVSREDAELQGVLGDVYAKLARHDQAARAFEAALPAARSPESKRVLFEKLGRAHLAVGRKDAALAAWRRIGELDGGSLNRRLQVAELLAAVGLLPEAAAAYEPLLEQTASDPAQQCRVLRDFGRLRELQGQLDDALAIYRQVLEKTARGNWLRKEVERRLVQIHRRTGKLEELVAGLQRQADEAPDDLATSELLVEVLIGMRQVDQAAAVLQKATTRFPKDVRLARRLAELYVERNDLDRAIAEYQRILTEKPDQLELYLELGTLFAKSERFQEARNQWEKALARSVQDASLCTRLAAMYATWQRDDDAVRLYERAIELEPEAMVRYTDLAEFLFDRARAAEAEAVLDRALAKASGDARRLETMAATLREHRLTTKARSCLEQVLQLDPANQEVRYALADLLLAAGEEANALAMLWQVVEGGDRGTDQRQLAANTLVNVAVRGGQQSQLVEEATARATPGALFVLGRLHTREREFDRAADAYRKLLEKQPADAEARRLLARLLAEEGDFFGALGQYEQLALAAPGERQRQFREVARLHLEMFDLEKAIEVWRTAMRDNPDNAAVFVEVGKEFLAIQRVPEALEAFQQAARLKGRDPGVQLRLADALRQAGKPEDAERQLLDVATGALDGKDREQARLKLFELYAEQGVIDRKIEELNAAIAENPYEPQAPHLLADLYMRTGDLALGLEMVERCLHFQPRNKELMTRRAELLESLEEWEQALAVHEELLKFPDADQDLHLSGMAQALFEMGRTDAARDLIGRIRDRGRVNRLFEKYDLHDAAIDFYQRAVARAPGDVRSWVQLAEQLQKRNRQEEAIAALEQALNLRPYYRQALEPLGKLYVQVGRREDAVRVGMRLFGLRGEEVEKTRSEEIEEDQKRQRSRWSYDYMQRTSFNQQRLQAAQQYFEERGLDTEWGRILVAEAKRRPADTTLLSAVREHYSWRERSATKAAEFLRGILATDFSELRVPPGHTARSYASDVESQLVDIWRHDVAATEARLRELGADLERLSVTQLRERAMALQCIGKLDEMQDTLRAVLAREPQDPIAHALLAERAVDAKQHAAAIEHLRAVLAWWRGPGAEWQQEIASRQAASFATQRKDMLDALPRRERRRVTDEDLQAALARVRSESFGKLSTFSFPEMVPAEFAILCQLIKLTRATGDATALATAIEEARAAATSMGRRATLGVVLFQEEQRAAARPLLERVLEEGKGLQADPLQMCFWNRYQSVVRQAAGPLGEILAQDGELVRAYQVLREHGHGEKAELLLRRHDKAAEVLQLLQSEVASAAQRLEQVRAANDAELRNVELDYRDAVIELADFAMGEKDFRRAEDVYQDALRLLPDDLEVRQVIAELRLRRGDDAAAIAMHMEIVDVKRRRKRAAAGETAIPATRLSPTMPGSSPQSRVSSSHSYYVPWYVQSQRYEVASNYLAILQIHNQRNNQQGVLDTLRRIMQEDPATFRTMSWQVLDTLRNQDLGKKKLPILRILKSVVGNDEWLTIEYARACREEGELKEAKRTLEKLLARSQGSGDWYVEQATEELEKVRQKLGEFKVTVEQLRAEVAKDPGNVRQRMKLAERLAKDHQYAACLVEAQLVVERAPYMQRAKEMVVEAAAASGQSDVAIAMMRRLYQEATKTEDKLQRGVALVNWLYAEGQRAEAFTIMQSLEVASGGSSEFSPGNWFLDKHERELAIASYEKEIERQKAQPWALDQVRGRLARVELASGKEVQAIGRYLSAIDEASSLQDREAKWKALLMVVKNHPDPTALAAKLEAAFGKRTDVKDRLVMAAVAFARGQLAAAEQELRAAVTASSREVYLYPLLLGLRRLQGDLTGALELLDEMGRVYGGSDAMQYQAGTSLSERDRLKVERALILEEMGRSQEATALFESLVDETKLQSMLTLSQIYQQRKQLDRALEWRRRYNAKKGTHERGDLVGEATLLRDLGRLDEAMGLLREAYLMARGDDNTRSLLIQLHRKKGTLAEFTRELEQDHAKDPRDAGVRASLLSLYRELRRDADRKAIYVSMLEQPEVREQALNALAEMAEVEGDHAAVLRHLQALLELKGGDEKKQLYRRIAELQAEAGDLQVAEESCRKALDLETAAGWQELGGWLMHHEQEEAALAAYAKVLEKDPEDENVLLPFATAAWKKKDFPRALEMAMQHLRRNRGKTDPLDEPLHTLFLDGLAGLPEAEQRAMLEPPADDVAALERACVLRLARAELPLAVAGAAAVLAKDGSNLIAHAVRRDALQKMVVRGWIERGATAPADAERDLLQAQLDATEALRHRLEQEYVAKSDWNYYSRAGQLQDDIGRLHALLGDDGAAEAAWREQPLRRTPYNSNAFGSWRSDWQVRYAAEHWLGLGAPAKALRALGTEFLLRENPPWSSWFTALRDVGSAEQVEAFAWQRAFDPLELYGVRADFYRYNPYGGDYVQTSGMHETLLDLYRRQNRLDELRRKLQELTADKARKEQAQAMLDAIAREERDWTQQAERVEVKLEEAAKSGSNNDYGIDQNLTGQHFAAARLWAKAGRVDKALEHMRKVLDFESEALRQRVGGSSEYYVRYGDSSSVSGSNPFSFSFQQDNGWSSWYSSYGNSDTAQRAAAAALLYRSGDAANVAKAREVEADLLQAIAPRRRRARLAEIAGAYEQFEAFGEAVRLWRQALAPGEPKLNDAERTRYLSELADALRRAGDADGHAMMLAEWRADLEKRIAEAPGPHALELRGQLVDVLLQRCRDHAAAESHLAMLRRLQPESTAHLLREARMLRLAGKSALAVSTLRTLAEVQRRLGLAEQERPAESAELGLALLGTKDGDAEGRQLLRRVLPRLEPSTVLAEEIVATLPPESR